MADASLYFALHKLYKYFYDVINTQWEAFEFFSPFSSPRFFLLCCKLNGFKGEALVERKQNTYYLKIDGDEPPNTHAFSFICVMNML